MKCKALYFLLPLLSVLGSGVGAQPVLTAATNGLQAGYNSVFFYSRSAVYNTPGSSGPGQTWDFSGFIPSYNTAVIYATCASTPYCRFYPGADVARFDTLRVNGPVQARYFYYKGDNSQTSQLGYRSGIATFINSAPQILLKFPFNYLDTFRSTYKVADSTGTNFDHKVVDSVVADGWGTIKTPAGTFANVLRVKAVITYTDTAGIRSDEKDYFYYWYSPLYREPVYSIQYYTTTIGEGLIVGYSEQQPTAVNKEAGIARTLQVLPNPAREKMDLRFKAAGAWPATVILLDMTGREVYRRTVPGTGTSGAVSIDVAALPRGLYLLRVSAGEEHTARTVALQ